MAQLKISIPADRLEERRYAVDVIFRQFLGLDFDTEVGPKGATTVTDGSLTLEFRDALFATGADAWLTEASLPAEPIARWNLPPWLGDDGMEVPILYGRAGPRREFTERTVNGIVVRADLLGGAFFLLTGYEDEADPSNRDEHGRRAGTGFLLDRCGLAQAPVVDIYVEVIRRLLQDLWPRLKIATPTYSLRVSCDVDEPLLGLRRGSTEFWRRVGADVIKRRQPARAAHRLRAAIASGHSRDRAFSFDFIMDVVEASGLGASFYFPAGISRHPLDAPWSLDAPWAEELLRKIADRGHRIGLHPSYTSVDDGALLAAELDRLRESCRRAGVGSDGLGARQHFLRWSPGSWRAFDSVGLEHDASAGFSDLAGFRVGTARDYSVFDLQTGSPLDLVERPLHLMDVTVLMRSGAGVGDIVEAAAALAAQVRRFGGNLNLLWHNDRLVTRRERIAFREMVRELAG